MGKENSKYVLWVKFNDGRVHHFYSFDTRNGKPKKDFGLSGLKFYFEKNNHQITQARIYDNTKKTDNLIEILKNTKKIEKSTNLL